MIKKLVTVLVIGFILGLGSADLFAQRPSQAKEPFIDRLAFGGYLGFQFGTILYIDVSPMVIYRATDWLYPGMGFTYMYYKDNRYIPAYTSSYYGPRFFASAYVWQGIFGHVEYEALNVQFYDTGNRGFIHNVLIGGGYRQWIGNRAFMMITVLFNLNESIYSPYRNPIIRIGFGGSF